jgi:hypothetical protein
MQAQRLTIKQTATGYWTVERGATQLAGAMTRQAAERERDLLRRLSACTTKRTRSRTGRRPSSTRT